MTKLKSLGLPLILEMSIWITIWQYIVNPLVASTKLKPHGA